jgi:hypothetical protein
MKARVHIVTIAVAAAAAIGTQAAEAHMLAGNSGSRTAKSASSSKSVLAVMTDAGFRYHAAEILRSEKQLAGGTTNAKSSKTHIRPGDRPDPRIMELKRRFP